MNKQANDLEGLPSPGLPDDNRPEYMFFETKLQTVGGRRYEMSSITDGIPVKASR